MNIKIAWLYPDLMDTYGDRGNILCLLKRCRWRDIGVDYRELTLEDSLDGDEDLLFMGGAQDRQQKLVLKDLQSKKGKVLLQSIEDKTPALFVCAGFQMMGRYYKAADGERIEGLGLFDMYTVHPGKSDKRLIGNVVVNEINLNIPSNPDTLVGFENHGGRTFLGENIRPLGLVQKGFGNNGKDRTEGAVYKNALGSYLHGPILPKNPHLADFLIKTALERKYKKSIKLQLLDDNLEWQAHNRAVIKAQKES